MLSTDLLWVVIIIPTYNERGNIEKLVPHLLKDVFPKIPARYQMGILVVDDSSPDKTALEVQKMMRKNKQVHLLVNKRKVGLGSAYIAGMRHALEHLDADVVFEFDADFSHDPKKIPQMLAKLDQGYDMVLGSRYIPGGSIPSNWGIHRKFLSMVGNLTIRVILGNLSIHDWTGGFRAIRKTVVKEVLPKLNRERFMGYTFQIGLLHQALRNGFKVAEVPFHFKDRTLGKSKLGSEHFRNTLYYILSVRIKELLAWRVFRFAVVGVIGATVQLGSLQLIRLVFPFQIATFLSIELAVLSNFIWSNLWTFADRQLALDAMLGKFLQFNLASAGSIAIQQVIAFVGEKFIGLYILVRIFGAPIDTGLVYAITGILLGMFWNFFAYSKIIWRQKQ